MAPSGYVYIWEKVFSCPSWWFNVLYLLQFANGQMWQIWCVSSKEGSVKKIFRTVNLCLRQCKQVCMISLQVTERNGN